MSRLLTCKRTRNHHRRFTKIHNSRPPHTANTHNSRPPHTFRHFTLTIRALDFLAQSRGRACLASQSAKWNLRTASLGGLTLFLSTRHECFAGQVARLCLRHTPSTRGAQAASSRARRSWATRPHSSCRRDRSCPSATWSKYSI